LAFNTIIGASDLANHIGDSQWAIVDCRFQLADVQWGEREYGVAHIPGASYAHLDKDLSGQKTGSNGRHPLPEAAALVQTFIRLGIGSGMQVVAYDQDSGMFASRLWWLLRWMGHDAVAVLDGGFAKWTAEGRPVERAGSSRYVRSAPRFTGAPRVNMIVDVNDVAATVEHGGSMLVDARAPERYRGDVEPLDRVPGHIPGAVNRFFQDNVGEDGLLRSPADLRETFSSMFGGVPTDRVVCYCGSGVTACHNLLALEHAGLPGAKLYAGSWSEWCSDSSRPIEESPKKERPAM
jgi:thiosulfate/3-mercaptopyruvate sulfurtransferase